MKVVMTSKDSKLHITSLVALTSWSAPVDLYREGLDLFQTQATPMALVGAVVQGMLRVFRRETGLAQLSESMGNRIRSSRSRFRRQKTSVILKDLIKEKQSHRLNHVDASALDQVRSCQWNALFLVWRSLDRGTLYEALCLLTFQIYLSHSVWTLTKRQRCQQASTTHGECRFWFISRHQSHKWPWVFRSFGPPESSWSTIYGDEGRVKGWCQSAGFGW